MKQQLIQMMVEKSFKYSSEPSFKLVSGKMSRFYINCKPTTLNPQGMVLIGQIIFDMIKGLDVKGIGGLTFGADPIAMAVAYTSALKNRPMNAFSIRKTQKDHGIIKWMEGDMTPGDRVVIIDDVATTGGSTVNAIHRARSEKLEVVKAVILVDRQEGGLENIRRHVDAVAVITKDDLMAYHEKHSK